MSEKHCWPAATDKTGLDLIWNYTPHASTACLLFAKGDQLKTTTIREKRVKETLIMGQKPSYGR